ncbi:MAG TPA: hypothetical protein VN397_01405 [Candidatus Methylomirabilis sp.]|nr:hypothetical protein [Candidatus Methylomirabilis sp.]
MKQWILLTALVFLGAGCGDDYVTGASSGGSGTGGFIIPGNPIVSNAIVAPDLKNISNTSGLNEFSFTLTR